MRKTINTNTTKVTKTLVLTTIAEKKAMKANKNISKTALMNKVAKALKVSIRTLYRRLEG